MIDFRLRLTQRLVVIFFFLVIIRLFYWQVIRGSDLSQKASTQRDQVRTLPSYRGNILADDKSLLVGTKESYLLFVYTPQLQLDKSSLIERLTPLLAVPEITSSSAETVPSSSKLLEMTKEYLTQKLDLSKKWIAIKHHLSRSQRLSIEQLNIPGLGFDPEPERFYPESSSSAQLFGFVGQDNNGLPQGFYGLEGYYDRQLQGQSGLLQEETDARGRPILLGDFKQYFEKPGRNLVTTINRALQFQVEKKLRLALEKYGSKQGVVIVMETKTGAIKTLASYPSFDTRIFYKFDASLYQNIAIAHSFEPGSIFKPLVMAAAIDAGVVTPDTQCDICDRPIKIGDFSIGTWNNQYHPNTTMTQTIVNSDNTGMVYTARKLNKEKLEEYLQRFGIGKKTGIDLQEEIASPLRPATKWSQMDLATISFGQGIATTPIQIITAINAIANDGQKIAPYVVSAIQDDNRTQPLSRSTPKRVISSETAKEVTEMMISAVKDGEAKWTALPGLTVAGKTGTAQIAYQGKYQEDKTIASFVGFAPAHDPKFTMLVVLWEPSSSQWGSETAAPLWFDIARDLVYLLRL